MRRTLILAGAKLVAAASMAYYALILPEKLPPVALSLPLISISFQMLSALVTGCRLLFDCLASSLLNVWDRPPFKRSGWCYLISYDL